MTLPGKIESIKDGKATVISGSKKAQIDLGLVLDAEPGDWILYHANRAIRGISEEEGNEIRQLLSSFQSVD